MDKGKDRNRKEVIPLPPTVGLRRSARLRDVPPPPPSREGQGQGGSDSTSASEKKRPRLGKEEREGVSAAAGDDVMVQQVNSGKVGSAAAAAGRSEVKTSEEGEEAHPCLFIENILDVIFKHIVDRPGRNLDVAKDVQSIRLVCKTWTTSVTRLYRQTRASATFDDYAKQDSYRRRKSLTQFMETMGASDMIPVQKFKFHTNVFPHDNLGMFRNFLVLCGPQAVSLHLDVNSSDAARIMANLENLADVDFQMMKLKTLGLHFYEEHHKQVKLEANQVHGNAKLLELLLTAATTLTELELSYPPCATPAYRIQQDMVLQQLSTTIANRLPRTVKQLELNLDMDETCFNNLSSIPSQLERVQLDIRPPLGARTLYQFLKAQAATLEHFEIFSFGGLGGDINILVEFPRLGELVHLDLPDSTISITAPWTFTDAFPKLECLMTPYMELENHFSTLLSTAKKPMRTLKVLHLPTWISTETAPLFKDVAKSFPCLTELHVELLGVTKETMGEIFTYFDNLEYLNISLHFSARMNNPNWAESLFSGIAEPDCFRIKRMNDFDNEDLNELQRQPSIRNLTSEMMWNKNKIHPKLRKLVMKIWGGSPWFTFTDFSAHFVFLEMDHLREIQLPVEFSPMYLELLRDKLILRG